MGTWRNTVTVVGIAVLGLLITGGCSGHSVRYGANSEGDGETALQENSGEMGDTKTGPGYAAPGQNGYPGGLVNGSSPSSSQSGQIAGVDGASGNGTSADSISGDSPLAGGGSVGSGGPSNFSGTDYGQNYSGVSGTGPNRSGVNGFGTGSAAGTNPDPEAWANAYLRGGESSQDFYGDPSKSGESEGGHSANPKAWGDTYMKENGGPSPEYVNPDLQIAKIQDGQATGRDSVKTSMKSTSNNSSTGIRMAEGELQDLYFAFDSWAITPEGAQGLEQGALWLQNNPGETLTIEGHCDQRGTQDYNLVLGKKRAEAAREYLEKLGIDSQRIQVVSYGKERPFCQNESEDCFQANRRSHMVIHLN